MRANKERKTPRLGVEAYWRYIIYENLYGRILKIWELYERQRHRPHHPPHHRPHHSRDNGHGHLSDQHGAVCRVHWRANTGEHSATDQEWQALNNMIILLTRRTMKTAMILIISYLGAKAIASQAMTAGPQKNKIVRLGPNLGVAFLLQNLVFRTTFLHSNRPAEPPRPYQDWNNWLKVKH